MKTPDVYIADQTLGAVAELTTDVSDVIKGYREMADRAEEDLKPVVEELLALHEPHAATLLHMVAKLGGRPEETGSVKGAVHTAVAAVRDWFDALDTSALSSILDGERKLLQSYNAACEALADHPEMLEVVARQRDDLESTIALLEQHPG